ncbi:TonB-dependent receptor [Brevundimonas sp. 2R-24]|uniref:TonB-dependent receptor n=1 Tax=Peiella sedimenti TaxID=3061083 RepID=A0ABT8SH80_9CAUL|nr:TonB-dependent receptor [Caulobacteraceae bacterium XZ-24]
MRAFTKSALLAGAAWSVMSVGAYAQDAQPGATAVEEVVVTARRTEERLQETPLSISAFSGEELEERGATNVTDLQGAVPNLNIVQGRGSSDSTNIYIRGIGQPDALQTFDPAVGVYVDDVYLSRIRGTQLELLDLQRVEVLRGPQGTLYGKNTIGGAVRLVTRTPDQGPYGNASLTYGDYNERAVRISGAAPINDQWAIGGAVLIADRDGYVTDSFTYGRTYNDRNVTAARLAASWTPRDNFRLDLAADATQQRSAMTVGRLESTVYTTDLALGTRTNRQLAPAPGSEWDFRSQTTPTLPNESPLSHWGVSATATLDLSDSLTLRSITAYRELSYDDYIDIDATRFELGGDVFVGVDQTQLSQEFQLNWDNGGRLTGVGGVYYMQENIVSEQAAYGDDLFTTLGLPTGFTRTIADDLDTTSWAAYANANFDVTDALRVTAGVRYTHESKDYWRTTTQDWTIPLTGIPLIDGILQPFNLDPVFTFDVSNDWSSVSPMLSADYRLSEDAMVYARVSHGFKSGGFNGRANNPGEQQPYDPETVISYEAGAKTDWFDGRLRANVALFYNEYSDFQARVSDCVVNPATPSLPCSISLTVLNAGELITQGAELELLAAPIDNLTLEAQVGYLDASYGEFEDVRFTAFGGSRAFQTPAFSPEWTTRLAGAYAFQLGDNGSLTLGGQARYRSEMALAVDNTEVNATTRIDSMFQDAYWLYDAQLVWTSADDHYTLGLYGRNLSDEVYKTDAQEFSTVGGIRTAYYGAPRTWSVTFTARF